MAAVVLLVIIIVVTLVLVRSFDQARRAQEHEPVAGPPRTRSRRAAWTAADEDRLAQHVAKLRQALREGLITQEEAQGSIVRRAGGRLSADAARELLRKRDAA